VRQAVRRWEMTITTIKARWATAVQAASYTGLSEKTIKRMVTDGRLAGHRPVPGRLLIDLRELDELIQKSAGVPGSRGTHLNGETGSDARTPESANMGG
jgi:excisionase family DNA binding protein